MNAVGLMESGESGGDVSADRTSLLLGPSSACIEKICERARLLRDVAAQ